MSATPPSGQRPRWVRVVLGGAHQRRTASICRAVSLLAGLSSSALSFRWPPFVVAMVLFLLAALLYDRGIAWVDRHDDWPKGAA